MDGMNKRLVAVALGIALILSLAGCGKKTTPDPAVEAYLNTEISAQKAFDAVTQVEYTVTQSQQNKVGDESGSYVFHIMIDKADPDNMRLEIIQDYYGDYIEDGISQKQVLLERVNGQYLYTTWNGNEEKQEEVDDQFVVDYITSYFYRNNNAFNEGGLYYGDFFMLYIYKYPASSFSVDTENDLCIFDEKMDIRDEETGNVHLHQISKINSLGLLVSNYERYESVGSDLVLLSELSAEYSFRGGK